MHGLNLNIIVCALYAGEKIGTTIYIICRILFILIPPQAILVDSIIIGAYCNGLLYGNRLLVGHKMCTLL